MFNKVIKNQTDEKKLQREYQQKANKFIEEYDALCEKHNMQMQAYMGTTGRGNEVSMMLRAVYIKNPLLDEKKIYDKA